MSDAASWVVLLQDFCHFIARLSDDPHVDYYGISDTLRQRVVDRAQAVLDAMKRDGIVPSLDQASSDEPRHKAYHLLLDLTTNSLPNDMWKPLPSGVSFYLAEFGKAIDTDAAGAGCAMPEPGPNAGVSIPTLDTTSGDWVQQQEAAKLVQHAVGTLRNDRSGGNKAEDCCRGIDRRGRVWRKVTKNSQTVWYLKESLHRS